ncbi:MAG TPA: cyclase family protein [Solirubrobacteraceae bacterium]|jgi:kynurenine formamidase
MSRLVDLSPPVPEGFRGPPSTDVGVQFDVRVKPGYWQSAQATLSCHTGCHVESALHVFEDGEPIDAVALDRVIGPAVVLDLTPVDAGEVIEPSALDAAERGLAAAGEEIRRGDIVLLRTDWAQRAIGTPRYFPESPALSEGAARWLVGLGQLPPRFEFFAPFYRFAGIDAAPARAFAQIADEDVPGP